MVMFSSETVHVRNVFSSKIVYAFFSFLLFYYCVFVCFLMRKSRDVTDFLFVDLICMLIHLNSSS